MALEFGIEWSKLKSCSIVVLPKMFLRKNIGKLKGPKDILMPINWTLTSSFLTLHQSWKPKTSRKIM